MEAIEQHEREWTSVGAEAMEQGTEHEHPNENGEWTVSYRPISRETVAATIEELRWRKPEGSFPMSPGLALQAAVKELGLPRVSAVAYNGGPIHDSGYSLMGIEANYKNGRARVYVMDRGTDLVPLAVDFWPGDRRTADDYEHERS